MKLVSFDIGLRHLSFCVLEGVSRADMRILHWDLIDVMAESAGLDNIKCFKCRKPANWVSQETHACTLHKGPTKKTTTKASLNKKTLEDLKKEAPHARTKKEAVDFVYASHTQSIWRRCVKSSKSMSVVDLAGPIAQCLEARKKLWIGADLVGLEQQPERRMMCVQAMIHMWFVCQGYACRGVSATHKLTNIVTLEDATKTYKGRKATGIVHARELVPTEKDRAYLMKHPKKDDLADCFLQGLWVLENG
jgi:hypothetical protein